MYNEISEKLPALDIIVPVYNQEQFIGRCLESINNQEYPKNKIKIIVIDDGSNDKSINIASKYDVKIICQDHKGVGSARNAGVNEASADLIAFLDSDDIASKSWINTSVDYLISHELDQCAAVGCSHYLINRNNPFIKIAWLEHLFRHNNLPEQVNHLGTSGAVFKKSNVVALGGFDTTLLAAEDMDLCSRIINSGFTLHLIKEPLIGVEYPNHLFCYLKKQIKDVGYMVVFFLKPKSIKRGKGSYSGYLEYIQGLFPFLFVLSTIVHNYLILVDFFIMLLLLILFNTPLLLFISNERRKINISNDWVLIVLPYFVVRSLAWSIGLVYGIFLALCKVKRKVINNNRVIGTIS